MWRRQGLLALVVASMLTGTAWADSADSYRRSYLLEARGDYEGALALMSSIRKAEGASYFVTVRTGWLAYLAGDLARAEAQYREAMTAKPGATEAKLGLSAVLYAAHKWKDLEAVCKQILADDAKHAIVRERLAAGYYAMGNYPDAAAIYRKLADEYPGNLNLQTGYAWALQRMGKREEARRIFAGVLAVSPENINAIQGMAAK